MKMRVMVFGKRKLVHVLAPTETYIVCEIGTLFSLAAACHPNGLVDTFLNVLSYKYQVNHPSRSKGVIANSNTQISLLSRSGYSY